MIVTDYEQTIADKINQCANFFGSLKLGDTYQLYYYTLFTKTAAEQALLRDELSKRFTLIDSSNGDTFEVNHPSFLPPQVTYLRVRPPDDSSIVVAGDVLGADIDTVETVLKSREIPYSIMERPTNRIISIIAPDSTVAIYFPRTHFLADLQK